MTAARAALLALLADFPGRLADAAHAAGGRPVAAGEWAPRDVVRHLVAVDVEVFARRLDQLAAEGHPRWSWVEPGLWSGPGDDSLDGALAAFAARRSATVERLAALDDAGWSRAGSHTVFGVLDVADLLRIAVDHDAEHLAQIRG